MCFASDLQGAVMAISKSELKSRPVCKVRFKLDRDMVGEAESVHVVGSFNNWNESSHPMKKNKNGSFSLEIEFPKGGEEKFRYLLNTGAWMNDPDATSFEYCEFAGTENSVLKL